MADGPPPIRPLKQIETKRTLLARLSGTQERVGVIDRAHQIPIRLGMRPNRVFLTWATWTGEERGEGEQQILQRIEILPTPKVSDLTAVALNPYSAGKLPVGSVRIDQISAGRYREDYLRGILIPSDPLFGQTGRPLDPKKDDFWFEVQEDGRNIPLGEQAERKRFRILGGPYLSPCCTQYSVIIERMSEDPFRNGQMPPFGDPVPLTPG
jgi:hypothetical protein